MSFYTIPSIFKKSPFIKLLYGPYEANGIIRHKTQRLHGIIQALSKLDYEIELVPSVHINRLSVEMMDVEIFRCDIRNLPFNLECEGDIVCKRLRYVIEEAANRLYDDDNFPKHASISRGKRMIIELKYARTTLDLFASSVKLWYEIPSRPLPSLISINMIDEEENYEEIPEQDPNFNKECFGSGLPGV